ncbi:MAG TPA: ATP-binding protein, partial [Chitinophagaceae bacterium]|nr:ATP-binding protein [Chitinophagaceae bacterium]
AEGAVTLNQDGTILYSNWQFASMVNADLSTVIGLSFVHFITVDSQGVYQRFFEKCWTQDCKVEVCLQAADQTIPVQLSFTPLRLDDNVSLSIILTDLTAQKTAQQQLEASNAELEASNHDLQQFASVASHDLQEPLRKIQIFSNLLQQKQTNLTAEATQYLQKIIGSAGRMKTLIIDILNYSALSANHAKPECVDLTEVARDLKEDFELIILEKEAQLHIDALPCVDANKGQMRQVFQNIISNALKFSRKGKPPVISITSKRLQQKSFDSAEQIDGPFCLITFKDNGIGFDEQYVANIFALFERLHAKDTYEGTGIGLAIAKKIIDKHNGLITATSREGKGAEFKIILPVTQMPPEGMYDA